MINVLLIEDSAVFVMGLKLALSADEAIADVNSVATPGSAVAFLNAHPETDVAVVDITLESETDGLTLLGIIREAFPAVRTLVLSHYKKPAYILRAIASGAGAYLAKDSNPQSVVKAIIDVASGKSLFFGETINSEKITNLFGGKENLERRKPQGLTERELEVLQLTTSGYSNPQIASAMEIALNTVDSYKERIKGKFGLDSIVECVAHAVADGLVDV
ncbi:MAG: response regulator transcription factor [Bacteroidales bacterium]|nr:response regulator transcription factor [Bacteroidales bacterium]MBP5741299.1 response regulator transcription factor [Bacteroidales bacterium]